jgi:hypothetical protein
MIGSLLLLLDIDGTLCPVGPGPDVEMRHLSIRAGAVSFRADLPEVLAELAARYELAWANAWQDNANLLLAPALGLPTLPVVRFTDAVAGSGTAAAGSAVAASGAGGVVSAGVGVREGVSAIVDALLEFDAEQPQRLIRLPKAAECHLERCEAFEQVCIHRSGEVLAGVAHVNALDRARRCGSIRCSCDGGCL